MAILPRRRPGVIMTWGVELMTEQSLGLCVMMVVSLGWLLLTVHPAGDGRGCAIAPGREGLLGNWRSRGILCDFIV